MASFTVSETRTYSQREGDITDYSQGCGYDYNGGNNPGNRVMRFTFTTDSIGASSIHWKLSYLYPWYWQNGIYDQTAIPLNFYIGTDDSSHQTSGSDETNITGAVTVHLDPDWISENCYLEGEADIMLLPNTTYYLWIFPAQSTHYIYVSGYAGQNVCQSMVITSSGAGGGVVYIKIDSEMVATIPYVVSGGAWKQTIPYIVKSNDWKICN